MKKYGIILLLCLTATMLLSCGDHRVVEPEYEMSAFPIPDSLASQPPLIIWEQAEGKYPVTLLLAYAPRCSWCLKMKQETLADSTVMGLIYNNFNFCYFDATSYETFELNGEQISCHEFAVDTLGITGTPTTVFFDAAGNEISRKVGFVDAATYAGLLREVYKKL